MESQFVLGAPSCCVELVPELIEVQMPPGYPTPAGFAATASLLPSEDMATASKAFQGGMPRLIQFLPESTDTQSPAPPPVAANMVPLDDQTTE